MKISQIRKAAQRMVGIAHTKGGVMRQAILVKEGTPLIVRYEHLESENDVGAWEEVNVLAVAVNAFEITKLLSQAVICELEDEILEALH